MPSLIFAINANTVIRASQADIHQTTVSQIEASDVGASVGKERNLITFPLAPIPKGRPIDSATLKLYFAGRSGSPTGKTLYLYKLTQPTWDENSATWNSYSTGNTWTAAGGDYATSSPDGATATVPATWGWISWDVKSLVQDAIDNGESLHLLLILEDEDVSNGNVVLLAGRDHATIARRPFLTALCWLNRISVLGGGP